MKTETATKSATMIATLQKITDLLATHPDLPVPFISIYDHNPERADLNWYFHINGRDKGTSQKALAQEVIKAVGGKWAKSFAQEDANFRQLRDGLDFHIVVAREAVCERVVTGTKTVTREVPDPSVDVPTIEVTEEIETVEWVCSPLLESAVA